MSRRPPLSVSALLLLALAVVAPMPSLRADEDGAKAEAERRPMLWVLEGERPVYLLGTVHLPDPRLTDLPAVVERAFAASDAFYAELAMEPGAVMRVQHLMMLPADESLDEIVGQEVWARLLPTMTAQGVPELALKRLKVWVVGLRLLMQAMTPAPAEGGEEEPDDAEAADEPSAPAEAMDLVLYRNAAAAGKVTGGLETLEEQIAVFDSLPQPDQVQMLAETLEVLEQQADETTEGEAEAALEDQYESIVRHYLAGDVEALGKALRAIVEEGNESVRKFMTKLLDDRSVRMADRILERRAALPGKTIFVAVGAGHFPGEKGILALLEAKGETVRQAAMDEAIPTPAVEEVPVR